MIGPDLVRVRRRGDQLLLSELRGSERERALQLGEELLQLAQAYLDESHESVEGALSAIDRSAREEKLFLGLRKLVMDECRFDAPVDVEPAELRHELFARAATLRQGLEPGERLDRSTLLVEVAARLGLSIAQIEQGLFADLRGAQQLIAAPRLTPEELVLRYQTAQVQGILLRAVRVTLLVNEPNSQAYRALFLKLKFRQLLHRIEPLAAGGYKIEIDGPFSLFDSVTKYGQKLALLVPMLQEVTSCALRAELRWGKERKTLFFSHEFQGQVSSREDVWPAEVRDLLRQVGERPLGFSARPSSRLLDLPGVGVVVPDFELVTPAGETVFVEVLGFWSREAVWRRVEWAESRRAQGQSERVLFAVSSRLRVSEEVLPAQTQAALYVYKGRMSARALCDQASRLIGEEARSGGS